jgi:hypothetical protein
MPLLETIDVLSMFISVLVSLSHIGLLGTHLIDLFSSVVEL